MSNPSIVWFRDDLRIHDNPALLAAAARGEPTVCVYVHDEITPGIRPLGGASRWWLHHSLTELEENLRSIGLQLTVGSGDAFEVITDLVRDQSAGAVYWNRRYGRAERGVDTRVKHHLRDIQVEAASHHASVLVEPWTLLTGSGEPYKVFSPYWKAMLATPSPRKPHRRPPRMVSHHTDSDSLDALALLPRHPDWADGLRKRWRPGEEQAAKRLRAFAASGLGTYREARDTPGATSTSSLSAHLRFGEISPFQVWHATIASGDFRRELGWRDFAHYVNYFWSDLHRTNLRPVFDAFAWDEQSDDALVAWQQGRTGVPLVDAGMRELWATGYMHNRVRMVAASYLVKNLLVDWRKGESWFWDTLVDADPASNPFNWQWVAGTGVDAAPYYRVFNPELQAEKFDPGEAYQRKWLPEFDTNDATSPLVDLTESRHRALNEYRRVTRRSDQGIRRPDVDITANR